MSTSTIPVSGHWFGVKGDDDPEFLGNPVQNEPGHPQLVGHLDALAGSDLELPLSGHHLCIGACNLNASVETGSVVAFQDVSSISPVGSNCTVVRSCAKIVRVNNIGLITLITLV